MKKNLSKRGRYADWATLFQMLGHPTRLAVMDSLKEGKKCVNDVCELLSVPQPNLSQHLAILRREGLVQVTEEGNKRCYELTNPELINALLRLCSGGYTARTPPHEKDRKSI